MRKEVDTDVFDGFTITEEVTQEKKAHQTRVFNIGFLDSFIRSDKLLWSKLRKLCDVS